MAFDKDYLKFRLAGGKTPVSWQLPMRGMMLERKDKNGNSRGLKRIHYIPGADNVWVEDYKGDEKPKGIFFEDGLLRVLRTDKNLVFILTHHRWFNKHYELISEDADAQKELDKFEKYDEAIKLLKLYDDDEMKANALALFGHSALTWTKLKTKAELRKKAQDEPDVVLNEMRSADFKSKYVAALAIMKGVCVVNETRTAVTWKDGKTIVTVPTGHNPIERLALHLGSNTEESKINLQEIGERIKQTYVKKENPTGEDQINEILGKEKVGGITVTDEKVLTLEPSSDSKDPTGDEGTDEDDEITLEEATEAYLEKFEKDVPNNKKNDLAWILSKLEEE